MDQNTVALVVIALANALTAFFAWHSVQQRAKMSRDIGRLEKNTNSMQDALVALTAKSSKAEGVLQGRKEQSDGRKLS